MSQAHDHVKEVHSRHRDELLKNPDVIMWETGTLDSGEYGVRISVRSEQARQSLPANYEDIPGQVIVSGGDVNALETACCTRRRFIFRFR